LQFAGFLTNETPSTVGTVIGLHGVRAVSHALGGLDGACASVTTLLHRMVDVIAEALVLVWRAKIATSNHATVRG